MREALWPSTLSPLCRNALTSLLLPIANESVGDAGLAWALYDAQWRMRFEPQPDTCDDRAASAGGAHSASTLDVTGSDPAASPVVSSVALPPSGPATAYLPFAVRDTHAHPVGGVVLGATLASWVSVTTEGAANTSAAAETHQVDRANASFTLTSRNASTSPQGIALLQVIITEPPTGAIDALLVPLPSLIFLVPSPSPSRDCLDIASWMFS